MERRPSSRADAVGRVARVVRRHGGWIALALAALHLALALAALQPAPHTGGDNAVYLSLARSLLADGTLRELYDPATPRHAQFPPGFAAILAAALAVGVKPWVGFKVLTALFSAAAVALTFLWIRRRRRPLLALAVATVVAVSPGVLGLAHQELSDVPFWAFFTAALLAWERPRRTRRTGAASLATAAAYLTRSAGLPLLLAAPAWLALRRRWRELAVFAAVVVPPAAAWWGWTRAHGGYAQLLAWVDPYAPDRGTVGAWDLVVRAGDNLALYGGRYLPALLVGTTGAAAVALGLAVVALALAGWSRRLRRPGVAELALPLYVAMLLAWTPVWAGERLLLPVLPMLLLYAGEGAAWIGRRVPALPRPAVPAAVFAALLLAALPGTAAAVARGGECRAAYRLGDRHACLAPPWSDFFTLAERAPALLPDGAVVLSRKPSLFHATSGLRGRTYPLDRTPDALLRTARDAGARYLVLDEIDEMAEQYLVPVLMQRPAAFCVVQSLGPSRATLFGILPGAERVPDVRDDPGAAEAEVGFAFCPAEMWRSPEARRAALPGAP